MDKVRKYIVGIDEVGRGPIAGPVCVCAFVLESKDYERFVEEAKEEIKTPLRDSKKLSKKQRDAWFAFLKAKKEKGECDYALSFVSSENIDKFGIAKCIQKALNESLSKISSSVYFLDNLSDNKNEGGESSQKEEPSSFSVFLDGGLHAPKEYTNQETVIKGDELHPVISLASIVAKVSRDRIMFSYSKMYPLYGFDKHVGYGTRAHYEAIKKHGQTKIHRKTFIHSKPL